MPRYDEAWVSDLTSPERAALRSPRDLLREAGAHAGATVVDVGCGPGFLTLPAARLVGPGGRVVAVDVEPRMLATIEEQAAAARLRNVTTVLARGPAIPLPAGCADVVVCALVLHDLAPSDRAAMAADLARVCRPTGTILVVEWQAQPCETRPNRLSPAETAGLLTDAGLEVQPAVGLGSPLPPREGMYRIHASPQRDR